MILELTNWSVALVPVLVMLMMIWMITACLVLSQKKSPNKVLKPNRRLQLRRKL